MKRFDLVLWILVSGFWTLPANAQTTGIEQPFHFVAPSTGGKFVEWYGMTGRSYFMQVSDPADHLNKWIWTPVIEAGNDEDISYEVDGTASKGFFRLKYTDQPVPAGQTVDTADFDGDGVANLTEIAPGVAFATPTDPLAAADADGDGIADDFEKFLSRQLLAFQPDPALWGIYYAGLALGNLDATHDYTGEGISAKELADVLRFVPEAGPTDTGYLVETMKRRNYLRAAFYSPPTPDNPAGFAHGYYFHSRPYDLDVRIDLNSQAFFTSFYLTSQIDSVEWSNFNNTKLVPWGSAVAFYYGAAASGFYETLLSTGTNYGGYVKQQKFRVIAQRADHKPLSEWYMKITSKRPYGIPWAGEFLSVEPFSIQIPQGHFFSEWSEFKATMVDGWETEMSLSPIEIMVPISVATSKGIDSSAPKPEVAYRTATEVSIATWENSFQNYGAENIVQWWVLNDSDHVKIRIPRPDKKGQGPIKATIKTTNPPEYVGVFDDPANEVNLTESTTEPGIFENTFLLVSNNVDDTFDGTDEGLDDQTHKITVGGELIIKYEGNEISRLKVKEKGRIKLRPLVLWDSGMFGSGLAVPTSEVLTDVKDIRRRFAQAGIAVEWDGAAWGIDVDLVPGASSHFRSGGIETLNGTAASGDETALSNYITATYPTAIGAKEIVMVYCHTSYIPDFFGFVAVSPKAYALIPSLATTLGVRPMIITTANRIVRSGEPVSHTLAHETLHMLLDDVHSPATTGKHNTEFSLNRRLWSGGPNDNAVTDRVRMSKTEVDRVVGDIQKSPLTKP